MERVRKSRSTCFEAIPRGSGDAHLQPQARCSGRRRLATEGRAQRRLEPAQILHRSLAGRMDAAQRMGRNDSGAFVRRPLRRGAWFAAMMPTAIKKLGTSLNAFSAQDSDALRNRLDSCRAVNSRTNADEAMLQGLKQLLVEAPRVTFSIASERPHRHSQKRVPNIVAQRSSALQNPEAKDP
jgi:hypothetical protein